MPKRVPRPGQLLKWMKWWLDSSVQHLNMKLWQVIAVAAVYLVPVLVQLLPDGLLSSAVQQGSWGVLCFASLMCVLFFGGYGLLAASLVNLSGFIVLLRGVLQGTDAVTVTLMCAAVFAQLASVMVFATSQRLQKQIQKEQKLNQKLEQSSLTDELTGVYNYRYFRRRLRAEIDRANRSEGSCTLLVADIDQFKLYNDINGHLAGDRALVQLAEIMKNKTRSSDTVARVGGEEFAIILPDTSAGEGQQIARRLTEAVAEHQFPDQAEDHCNGSLTVSIGLSVYPDWAEDINSLLAQADDAMYHAKHKAGNRAEIYSNVLQNLGEEINGEEAVIGAFRTLLGIISARDNYTYGHSQRVSEYSVAIARRLGLSDEAIKILRWSALLHDLGKIDVPEWVLNKRGPLDSEEWDYIKRHPEKSAAILRPVSEQLEPVVEVVRSHHERVDGEGYPQGLQDGDIPLEARILTVADAIDAMRSVRPYRDAMDDEEIAEELLQNSGRQFDERIAALAAEMLNSRSL